MIKKYKAWLNDVSGFQGFYFDTVEELMAGIEELKTVFNYMGGFYSKNTEVRIYDDFDCSHVFQKKRYESYASLYRKFLSYDAGVRKV